MDNKTDVQKTLDILSGMAEKAKENRLNSFKQHGELMFDCYTAYRKAGFKTRQAFELTKVLLAVTLGKEI